MAPLRRQQRRQVVAAAAALLAAALLAASARGSGLCPELPPQGPPPVCQALPKVCVDQNVYVLYDNRHNPRHEQFDAAQQAGALPDRLASLANVSYDFAGFGDVWGTAFARPPPSLRPATPGEETRELAHPQFSRCAAPLVLYVADLYRYADFFVNAAAPLHALQAARRLDKRHSLVIDTYGMRLEPWHAFLLAPFSSHAITTLSHMSSRLPLDTPEPYTPDGTHVRCFGQLLACQMAGESELLAGLQEPLWSTGQAVVAHYKWQLPAIDPDFADASKLRVLIAALPRSSKRRALLNQEQVWSWCNKFQPPRGVKDWNGTACLLHHFGKDLASDVAYASQADVLLGVHGHSLVNAFMMRRHSSVLELRPFGHAGRSADRYMKELTRADNHSIFWWGVDVVTRGNSMAGGMELSRRGAEKHWPRDRHTFIRLMALQYLMERVSLTRQDAATYQRFRDRGEHHINDRLAKVNATQARRHERRLLAGVRDAGGVAGAGASAAAAPPPPLQPQQHHHQQQLSTEGRWWWRRRQRYAFVCGTWVGRTLLGPRWCGAQV